MSRQWVKLHTVLVNDPKMHALSDSLFRVCINLLCVAGLVDDKGRLGDVDQVCFYLRKPPRVILPALEQLAQLRITECKNGTWILKNWAKYNEKPPSDSRPAVRERVAKYRQNKATKEKVTPLQARYTSSGNADVTPQNRIEENRIENPLGADAPSDPLKDLAQVFEQASGIKLPTPTTAKGKDTVGVRWWNPLRQMLKTANGSAPDILRAAVLKMRRDKLTFDSPASVIKVFTSLHGERAAPVQIVSKVPEL